MGQAGSNGIPHGSGDPRSRSAPSLLEWNSCISVRPVPRSAAFCDFDAPARLVAWRSAGLFPSVCAKPLLDRPSEHIYIPLVALSEDASQVGMNVQGCLRLNTASSWGGRLRKDRCNSHSTGTWSFEWVGWGPESHQLRSSKGICSDVNNVPALYPCQMVGSVRLIVVHFCCGCRLSGRGCWMLGRDVLTGNNSRCV